jgi:hypothetical protein
MNHSQAIVSPDLLSITMTKDELEDVALLAVPSASSRASTRLLSFNMVPWILNGLLVVALVAAVGKPQLNNCSDPSQGFFCKLSAVLCNLRHHIGREY